MISKRFINSLLEKVDIVDVVGKNIKIKKAGSNNFVGLCPFHNEKSPSFTVSQEKQFYHCFGCGAHGSAIGFLVEHAGMGFVEAVEALASQHGMAVIHDDDESGDVDNSAPLALLKQASAFYQQELKTSKVAIDYLKGRGISGEVARDFNLGFAGDGNPLRRCFKDWGADKNLDAVGLVRGAVQNIPRLDFFRNRIIFPIHDAKGNVIAFGGRVLKYDGKKDSPKYLNSTETSLFEKGHELYGLFQAQKAIRAASQAIVVEGYTDVIALAQAGVKNVVGCLGTAMSAYNIHRLLRMADEIVFCFDGDTAGKKAAARVAEIAMQCILDGKRISFMFLPENLDPDEFIKKYGKDRFDGLAFLSETITSFVLNTLKNGADLKTMEGRSAFIKIAKEPFDSIKLNAPGLAYMFKAEIAILASSTIENVDALFANQVALKRSATKRKSVSSIHSLKSKKLLFCVVSNPLIAKEFPAAYLIGTYLTDDVAEIIEWAAKEINPTSLGLMEKFKSTPLAEMINETQAEMLLFGDGFNERAEFDGILREIRREELEAKIAKNSLKIEASGLSSLSDEDKADYRATLAEYRALIS